MPFVRRDPQLGRHVQDPERAKYLDRLPAIRCRLARMMSDIGFGAEPASPAAAAPVTPAGGSGRTKGQCRRGLGPENRGDDRAIHPEPARI